MTKPKLINENSIGGLFLILGSIVLLTTIYFEYSIGWIGNVRTDKETNEFILSNWENLKHIWKWQMLSHFVYIIGYFVLLKKAEVLMRILWSILTVCSILMLVAFGLTLGTYYQALEVYNSEPAIFETIRGGIGYLYQFGRYGLLLFVVAFLVETLNNNGRIQKVFGFSLLAFIILLFIVGYALGISVKIIGATFFLLPLAIGYFYLKNGMNE
jgi:peptidoglycan/LPS O-acetylase OafA/YrhL